MLYSDCLCTSKQFHTIPIIKTLPYKTMSICLQILSCRENSHLKMVHLSEVKVLLKKGNRTNKGSQAYWSLAKEVSDRVKKMRHKYGVYEKNHLKMHKLNQSNEDDALSEQLE